VMSRSERRPLSPRTSSRSSSIPVSDRCWLHASPRLLLSISFRRNRLFSILFKLSRRNPHHWRPFAGEPFLPPAKKPIPDAARIDLQRVTHALEENGPPPSSEDPESRFPKFLLFGCLTRVEINLKRSHRIGEDCEHQAPERLD
jgi:hypothetical protein